MTDTVEKFLNRILKACEGKRYLFRGTTKSHEEINSSLYRWAKDKEVPFHEKYGPFSIEKETLERAKRHFADTASNIEMLTDLQHLQQDHGKTNLIDFSRNLYIALFFACDEEHHKEDGELLLLDSAKIEKKQAVVYKDLKLSSDPFLIEPANTQISQKRVTFQNSVFVYPSSGYINKKDWCKIITVPADLKQPILDHLREVHNIHTDTIYNDLIGFIANEKNYETASVLFHQGLASSNKGEYEEAMEKYNESIELNSNHAETYNNRGFVKDELGQYHEAIADYDKAIELNPNNAEAYNNRGGAKYHLGRHPNNLDLILSAIADYDKAIELNSDFAEACYNRGLAKDKLKQHREAISDLNKALELNPDFAEAYNSRGNVKNKLRQYQEAISDFNKAIELDPNDAKAYHNRGVAKCHLEQYREAVSDFNKAIELDPNDAKTYYNRGRAEYDLEQYQEVIADCDKAIGLEPNYEDAYQLRGVAYQALGQTQDADADFKIVAKLKSDEAS